jgi:hypothetical protein
MSKERELLKKALDFMLDAGANLNPLFKEINDNLLAQPEQSSTTRHALDSYWNQEAYQRGYARAELDLKREPLGLEIMDVCGTEDYREGFKDGALYAEKCHDIGGGE